MRIFTMSLILLFATLVTLVSNQVIYDMTAVPSEEDDLKFLSYVAEFGKSYRDITDYDRRLKYFMAVDAYIRNYTVEGV